MRLVDDEDLSICLTISTGISRDTLLNIFGREEVLAMPQSFDDFIWEDSKPGQKGILNIIEEGDLMATMENNGFMGVSQAAVQKIKGVTGLLLGHYLAIYRSHLNPTNLKFVEVQDGLVLADFHPALDEAPEAVAEFFPNRSFITMQHMVNALEYRMECQVGEKWLEADADTYVIDYVLARN